MSNLSTESSVIHKKNIKILDAVNDEFLQTVGQEEFSCVI